MKTAVRSFLLLVSILVCSNAILLAEATGIIFQYSQSLIFIKVRVNNKSNLLFLMDTGANTSVIDKTTANFLRIPTQQHDTVLGTAGKEPVELLTIRRLQVDNAEMNDLRISKRDLSKFIKLNNQKLDGILGMDFLKKFSITIDFRNRRIAFSKKAARPGVQVVIPFETPGNSPTFQVRFNDTFNTYLHYNSGVSSEPVKDIYVNVGPSQWNNLKRINRSLAPQKYLQGNGVGGNVYLQVVKIDRLEFQGLLIKEPYMVVQPQEGYFEQEEAIGFFGNNLLEKYRKVILDFNSNQLIFCTLRKIPKAPKLKPA